MQLPTDTGRTDAIIATPTCANARTICVDNAVWSCIGNKQDGQIEVCDGDRACSLGRCTTEACRTAEGADGTNGCLFYGVQPDNIDSDDDKDLMLILSNPGPTPAEAQVERPMPAGIWEAMGPPVTVPERGGVRIRFNIPVREPGLEKAGAYRVISSAPMLAVQIVSDDVEREAHSSAGTVLRPIQALAFHHLAITAPAVATPDVLRMPGSRGGAGAIAVVATEGATIVSIKLTAPAIVSKGGQMRQLSEAFDTPMDGGDVLQIFSSNPGGDLTGTAIDATRRVAVFSGNVYATYENSLPDRTGDLTQEQLPPTTSWGKSYLGARLSSQQGCDSEMPGGASQWRVLAANPNTVVRLVPARGVLLAGSGLGPDLQFVLQARESRTFYARSVDGDSRAPADFLASSEQPFLLAQSLGCEPGLSWGVDLRLQRKRPLAVTLPPGFLHEIVVVRKRDSEVKLDGQPLDDAAFQVSFAAADGYEVARVDEGLLGKCRDLADPCEHVFEGRDFGVTWRGMDVVCSYSLVVPPEDFCGSCIE